MELGDLFVCRNQTHDTFFLGKCKQKHVANKFDTDRHFGYPTNREAPLSFVIWLKWGNKLNKRDDKECYTHIAVNEERNSKSQCCVCANFQLSCQAKEPKTKGRVSTF